jgi:hypothetical protein
LNAWTNLYETWYAYHGTWAHLNGVLHKSLPSVCVSVCVFPLIVARQRLCKHVPATTNTRNNRRIIGRVVFYAIRVVSKESLWVCLSIPLLLLGNGSVNTFSRQPKIVGGVIFYQVRVVLKESKGLILPRTSCYYYSICPHEKLALWHVLYESSSCGLLRKKNIISYLDMLGILTTFV